MRASRREWFGLAVIVLPCLLVSMDLSVLFYALPFLSADLAPSSTELLWILDVYGFVLAGFLVLMGSLGDRIGRRRVLLGGAVLFGAASVAAAFAPSTGALILARAALGVAGATLAPSTLSLIRTMFVNARERQVAVSIWTTGFAGGAIVGPIIGGLLLERFWWGSVFLLNVPVMVLLLALGPVLLPESRHPQPGRFDLLGAALSLAAVLPMVYGVKGIAAHGFTWTDLGAVAIGTVLGAAFVHRMRTARHPMIDVRLFRRPQFSGAVATCTVTFVVLAGTGLFVSQYLQLVLGYSPFESALWSLPGMAGMIAGVTVATAASVRPAVLVASGLVVAAVGFALFAQVGAQEGVGWIVASQVVIAAGIGAVATVSTDLVLATAPAESAGAAAAVSETANEFGGAAGIALMGSLGAAVYRDILADDAAADLPPGVLDAAQETLGAAAAAASRLPAPAGEALLSAAAEAFVTGLRAVAWTGAAGTVLIAAFVLVALRGVPHAAAVEPVGSER